MSLPPRRRPSAAVYRRRRLVLLLALLTVILGVALLIWRPWNGAPVAASSPLATPSPTSTSTSPSPSPTPAADADVSPAATGAAEQSVAECTPSTVQVAAVTDDDAYGGGENPQLSITLTNQSATPCTLDVGSATQRFEISSGADVWWRSTDCQSEPTNQIVTIDPGQTVSSVTPLVWDRTRSSVATCGGGEREQAPAGGSSYHLSVSIGGIESGGTKQFLLR